MKGFFWHCRRGVTAVEFALTTPMIFVAMVGLFEIAMILSASVLMEGGVREAARFGITGSVPAGTSREQMIRQIVADNTMGLIDMANLQVTTLVYKSFDQIGQPEPFTDTNANGQFDDGEPFTDVNGNGQWDADMGAAGAGGPGDVVVYTLTYNWPLMTPLLNDLIGHAGTIPLRASIAVRNEPYPTGGG